MERMFLIRPNFRVCTAKDSSSWVVRYTSRKVSLMRGKGSRGGEAGQSINRS